MMGTIEKEIIWLDELGYRSPEELEQQYERQNSFKEAA